VFRAVVTGEAGAGLLWLPPAAWMARDAPGIRIIALTAEKDLDFPVGAGVRRRERELAAAVDAAIGRLRAAGRVDEILNRYRAIPPAAGRRGPAPAGVHPAEARDPVDAGRVLFKATCAHCHGADGAGAGSGGRVPPIKHYEGGREKFLRVVRDGRRGTPMGGFRGILTDDEMETIYRYLTSFSRS
jgi:cytochrome c553